VLEHRFRFDVEIAEFSSIRTGEFDIEILGWTALDFWIS
jgi:hypothetical protein